MFEWVSVSHFLSLWFVFQNFNAWSNVNTWFLHNLETHLKAHSYLQWLAYQTSQRIRRSIVNLQLPNPRGFPGLWESNICQSKSLLLNYMQLIYIQTSYLDLILGYNSNLDKAKHVNSRDLYIKLPKHKSFDVVKCCFTTKPFYFINIKITI